LGSISKFSGAKRALFTIINGKSGKTPKIRMMTYHKRWAAENLGNGKNNRDEKWTRSIAVSSRGFVDRVKSILGALAL
jgi:hypothetical protein